MDRGIIFKTTCSHFPLDNDCLVVVKYDFDTNAKIGEAFFFISSEFLRECRGRLRFFIAIGSASLSASAIIDNRIIVSVIWITGILKGCVGDYLVFLAAHWLCICICICVNVNMHFELCICWVLNYTQWETHSDGGGRVHIRFGKETFPMNNI